ncbi:BRCA1-associated RING domain protein 1-like isoform X1 [Myzus persicae]|uniref:BRCA1-associated RING domain protein 1-like isoform X1 n=1 Tax=Myzus persicae TaxID=13164 RepID=UPI000B939115|nr:BRCA1-associated RING domain protein 1-like isoform X1 [Myzus persicae]XP_022170986.1 BRCA1-associated RING domain protein 1-like isoform X1 [Myzus persicae]
MSQSKTSQESEIYLYNSEYLKNNYDKYIRDDFLYAFGAFYCDKVMKIPQLDRILKTECYHRETELKYRHNEFATYMENIISWLDLKLKYCNGEPSESNKKIQEQLFKTSDIQQHGTKMSLSCTALDSNTSSHEQNNKSRTEAYSQNEIITSPDITIKNDDFPGSSINDDNIEIFMQNTQNKLIMTEITSPKHNSVGSSTNNNNKKGIDKVNNTQNIIKTSPNVTSPEHDTLGNSTTDHKKRIDVVNNTQNKIITSPGITSLKHVTLGNSTNDHKKGIDMVNNTHNKVITSPDVTSPKCDTLGISTNNHKKGIDMENNQSKLIASPKDNSAINTNLVNISSAVDSISTESQFKNLDITDDENESTSDNLKNNTNDKVVNKEKLYSAQTSSSNIISEEISNMCLETSTKSVRCTRANKQTSKKINTSTKRSNSVTDSEHKSKKKKIEKPSPSNVGRKTNTNNNKISVKVLNESIKQVTKNLYCRNSKGETKLHSACAKGKLDLVTSLLEDGFNPNVKDNAGWTPMHEAVKSGNIDIVKELIKFGAYLNVPGFEYESPLYTAIKYGKFEIAKILLSYGSDANCMNMYGDNVRCLNEEKLSELLENLVSSKLTQICLPNYKLDETVIALNNVSLKSETVKTFCKQFNIKLVQNILKEKQFAQITHMIVSKTKSNTCDVNLECLSAIANGLFIINENWISDSLDQNKLLNCEHYEVSGTTLFADCNGPKISRISKQKLYPKLFDGINIHISGSNGWNQFTIENLKKLVVEFGAKLLIRMPNPEDCPTNIIPYHCRNNDQMFHVSTIILYTMDSSRLIKYNMKHLKAFHISWFMQAVQKYNII